MSSLAQTGQLFGFDIREHEAVVFDFSDVINNDASAAAVFSRLPNITADTCNGSSQYLD